MMLHKRAYLGQREVVHRFVHEHDGVRVAHGHASYVKLMPVHAQQIVLHDVHARHIHRHIGRSQLRLAHADARADHSAAVRAYGRNIQHARQRLHLRRRYVLRDDAVVQRETD